MDLEIHILYRVISPGLIKTMVDKCDTKNRVFRFGKVEICPSMEEYSRLIGAPHDCENVIIPCFEPSFKQKLSRTFGIKKKLLVGSESLEHKRCPLSLFHDLYWAYKS